ncbi:MAG TPA: PAS domain S-box protein [Coleofasciculaceae cyanobacterium]
MKSPFSTKKTMMTTAIGATLLMSVAWTLTVSNTSIISLSISSLGWGLCLLLYYVLNRHIARCEQANANFQDLYNNAPFGYLCVDANGTLIEINDTELSCLGYSRDQVISKLNITDLLTPESVTSFWAVLKSIQSQEWVKNVEIQMLRQDGTILSTLLSASAIKDAAGHCVTVRATIVDITQYKQTEKALRQSEERFRLAVDRMPDAFVIYDAQRRLQFVNAEGLRRSRLPLEALLGRTDEEIHPPEIRSGYLPALLRAAETRTLQKTECTITLPTTGTFTVAITYVPLLDEQGELYQILGITHDMTEYKRVEAALRESEERLRLALEAAQMATWDWNVLSDHITWSSGHQQVFGLTSGTLDGSYETFEACLHPEDRKSLRQAMHRARKREGECHHQFRLVWSDGSIHWVEGKGKFFYDESGRAVRMLGTLMDITDVCDELRLRKQAETDLRQSEEKFRQLAENIHEVFWMTSAHRREIIYVSPAYEQIWGRSCESLYANPDSYVNAIHPDDRQQMMVNLNHNAAGTFDIEYRLIRPDGSIRWIRDRGFPIQNESGEIYRRAGIAQDITHEKQAKAMLRQINEELEIRVQKRTAELKQAAERLQRELLERKRVEEALRESEERWQLALRGSNDGIWDWNVKTNEVFFSTRWKEMRGFEEGEIGNHLQEWVQRIHPDDVDWVIQAIADHFAKKTPFFVAEYRVRCKDNSYKWICDRGQALWDETGNVVRMAGSETDITESKQAEEALRKQACIFENLYDAVILTDLDSHIIDWNPAAERMYGYAKADVLGKSAGILYKHQSDAAKLKQNILNGIRTAGRWAGEIDFIRKNGTEGVTETVVVPLHDEKGKLIAAIAVNRDITERKLTEAALRQAYDELEVRVQKRTMELFKANEELRVENAERKRVEAELKTRARQQAAVAELGQQALAGKPVVTLMNQAVALIAQILGIEYCKVLELLPDGKTLLLRVGIGWREGVVGTTTLSVRPDSQSGYTLLSTEPIIVEDFSKEVQLKGTPLLREHNVVSGMSVIIPGQNRPYGVLAAHTTRPRKFTEDDIHFLQATANVLATAINRQKGEEALRHAHDQLEIRVTERTTDLEKTNAELQQKIIELQLSQEERAKLIDILEATPDLVAMTGVDERIFYLNSAARKVFGFGENEDSLDFTIADAHPHWAYELVRNQGIPTAMSKGVWVGETAVLSHEGREIPVSQVLIAHKSPDGMVNMLSTVVRDITQQQEIAATLFEAERRWRSLLENVRLVVVGLDNQGKVEYVNPCFLDLVGYTKAEVIGKDWFETFLPQHQKKRQQNNFLELLEQKFYTHNQSVILTKSGEERVIAWNDTLLQNLQGYVVGTLSIGEDITERQVIERMKDEFISVVSHELRTPLTSIHGALNLLSSGLVDTQCDKGQRVIEIAAQSAERLVRLVNDILELERLESGKISLLKQSCNAGELIVKAIEMMQVMAHRAGVNVCVSRPAIEVYADPDRIIQVLTNLLGNAIKFSPRRSTVSLSVELENESSVMSHRSLSVPQSLIPNSTVVFKVKDQGRGIPADKLDSIFERFHQVDASDSRKKGGTGLGLAICRSIIQQHGGRIWVESTLGEGSCFYFTLPTAESAEESNNDH